MLKDRGILYDYAINAGGLINVAYEIQVFVKGHWIRGIYDILAKIKISIIKKGDDIAKLKNIYLPKKNVKSDNNYIHVELQGSVF